MRESPAALAKLGILLGNRSTRLGYWGIRFRETWDQFFEKVRYGGGKMGPRETGLSSQSGTCKERIPAS